MFGLPAKELKFAVEHADRTLAKADDVLVRAGEALDHLRGVAEDLHAITTRLRQVVEGARTP